MFLILVIPTGLLFTFGEMCKDKKQGYAVLTAMLLLFILMLGVCYASEKYGNPIVAAQGISGDTAMEGKEVRFGIGSSALFATTTTAASCGAVNSMHDSYTGLGGLVLMLQMMLGEVVLGGVGAGFYGMMLYVFITVFIVGLMVGRTPEYLGKKIEAKEIVLTIAGLLIPAATILSMSALSCLTEAGQAGISNPGPHGLSEILYGFASGVGNNGSAFAGLGANSQWYNVLIGLAMLIGRFAVIVPVLAIAGNMAAKKAAPSGAGTFNTGSVLFAMLLAGVVLIVGALTFLPALALGPIVDQLLQRLKEGKVYRPQQAEQALRGFFRQGNISALRELALRFTARHVDQDMLAYMRLHKIEGPWPASGKVMVCVSASPFSAQLIRAAQRLAQGLRAEFLAVHIETPERRFPNGDQERERLWRNLNLAKEMGGQILTTAGNDFVETVMQIAVRENVTAIVVGKSGPRRWYELTKKTLVDKLISKSGFIHVYVIQGREENEKQPAITTAVTEQHTGWQQYLGAVSAVLIITSLCYVFRGQLELVNIALLYLLPVLLTAAWWGRKTAYMTAVLCVLGFDFLFLEPVFTFTVYDIRYLWSFLIFGLVAFLVGGKTESLRRELQSTRRRESNVNSLYQFSSRIAAVDDGQTIIEEFVSHVGRELQRTVLILVPEEKTLKLQACYDESKAQIANDFQLAASEYAVAVWVQEHGQVAGRSTETLSGAENLFLPLLNGEKVIGVVGIAIDTRKLSPEERTVLGAWVSLLAIALVRAGLSSEAKQAAMLRAADKLRNALFNSVSHELRTPLAAIIAAIYALNDKTVAYGEKQRQQLLETIIDASRRMERIIGNLLDTARMESGMLQLKADWCDLEDVISGALRRSKDYTQEHLIKVNYDDELPLVYADAALLEHVVLNLLDNAVKYSSKGSEIELQAHLQGNDVVVAVKDRGVGLKAKELPYLFDKFYRSKQTENISGTGLGLAICKGIIDAHHGKIWAEPRSGGGSVFAFTLSVTSPQGKVGEKND